MGLGSHSPLLGWGVLMFDLEVYSSLDSTDEPRWSDNI